MTTIRSLAVLGIAIWFTTARAQIVRQTTSLVRTWTTDAAVDDAGAVAFAISDGDPYGTNAGHRFQIFKWNPATGAGAQVTGFANGVDRDTNDHGPSVTDDGTTVVFLLGIIGAPAEIVTPARIGMMIMTPWTWSIAYRRFHQGVLIRFGHSRAVGLGTVIRLTSVSLVLTVTYLLGTTPGIVVATSAVVAGVMSEALYVGLSVKPVLRDQVRHARPVEPPLTFQDFISFYVPLAMTALLNLLVQPIGSAALSRMPQALDSLAVWPVISGLAFMLRSLGLAYNEVVVALRDEPGSTHNLRRFAFFLMALTTLLLALIAATPFSLIWFRDMSALSPSLAALARCSLWVALPIPAMEALQSWYQGALVHKRRTRSMKAVL